MKTIDLNKIDPDMKLLGKINVKIVRTYNFFPVKEENNVITVAFSGVDYFETGLVDNLKFLLSCKVEAVLCDEQSLKEVIEKYYGKTTDLVNPPQEPNAQEIINDINKLRESNTGLAVMAMNNLDPIADSGYIHIRKLIVAGSCLQSLSGQVENLGKLLIEFKDSESMENCPTCKHPLNDPEYHEFLSRVNEALEGI